MSETSISRRKVMPYGVTLGILLGLGYYLFLEDSVKETRLTFSVEQTDYKQYLELADEVIELEHGEVFLSPNYESISDTLKASGIRRFEVKKFLKGKGENEELNTNYFTERSNVPVPDLIKELPFGTSKPLGKTLGLSLLIIILSLILDLFINRTTTQRIK